ncbi:MAG: GAF domain-containing protein [Thermodesulfobacteriota bacterium]|nr:GAF domain-containing protein [Thermodesulfobacteriota bacterium]
MEKKADRRFYLKHFKAISHAISTYEDLNKLMKHLAEGTGRTFKAKGCCIMLFDEIERRLIHMASYGVSEVYLDKGPLFINDEDSAFSTGQPVFIEDMRNDPRVQYPEAASEEGIVSMLSIPIKCRKAIVGILRIYYGEPWMLHEEDIDSLCVLTGLLGLVIDNSGLRNFQLKVMDALDSLPPRMLEG